MSNNQPSADAAKVHDILCTMSSLPLWNTTTDKATAKAVLETEFVFCYGEIRDIRVKHLGIGVYKVFTELRV